VWVKKIPPYSFLNFFPKRLGIFNQFFTHLFFDHFYTRLQIFIQISPTLTKLCHTKRAHLANFYISLEIWLLSLLTEQMTSLLTSCHIPQPQRLAMWQLPSRLQFQNWTPRPSTNSPMTCDPSFRRRSPFRSFPHVCWHYKSVYFIVTCHRQRSTKLSTTFANVSMHAFRPMVDIFSILCELGSRA